VRTRGGSAWAAAPGPAAGCPECPQWALRSAGPGGLWGRNRKHERRFSQMLSGPGLGPGSSTPHLLGSVIPLPQPPG
jgi:hypothetical protein